jgi:D-serine dehydratase
MKLDLSAIINAPIPPGTKGVPLHAEALRIADIRAQNWRLTAGDLPTPVALLKASALQNNLSAMQAYLARAGMQLAPHGKTTMCPQLFERQLQAGAWGMTVATFAQARVALAVGVKRLLIANELVSVAEIEGLSRLLDAAPDVEIHSLVDSIAGVDRLQQTLAARAATRPLQVLVEIGMDGGRCGCRSVGDARALARRVATSSHLALRGVEGYEGLIVSDDCVGDARAVDAYLATLAEVLSTCIQENLFASGPILLSAGGSAYFDLVARALATANDARVLPIVRSGCYVTHDHGFYAGLLDAAATRTACGPAPTFTPALEVWTQVISRPESDLAILNAGKRDLSYDIDLPTALAWFRPGANVKPAPVADGKVFRLSDQHAFLRVRADADLRVGDFVGLGISHPCTTFDKWPLLLEVDDAYRVIDGLRTYF